MFQLIHLAEQHLTCDVHQKSVLIKPIMGPESARTDFDGKLACSASHKKNKRGRFLFEARHRFLSFAYSCFGKSVLFFARENAARDNNMPVLENVF